MLRTRAGDRFRNSRRQYFNPTDIAGIARSYGLNTDSSHRFERGVDFKNTKNALQRATSLIIEHCGGECSNILDVEDNLPLRQPIELRTQKISAIMGVNIKDNDVKSILDKLNLSYIEKKGKFVIHIFVLLYGILFCECECRLYCLLVSS